MKFSELKAKLDAMTPEQLEMDALWAGDGRGGIIENVWIVDDDQINPSGDGWEPLGFYLDICQNDPEALEELKNESIVVKKGHPILLTDGM